MITTTLKRQIIKHVAHYLHFATNLKAYSHAFRQLQIYEPFNQNKVSPFGYSAALSGSFMLIRRAGGSLVHTY